MNLPNKLTVSRLFLTVVFLVILFNPFPFHHTVGLVLFVAAGLTDAWDGYLARRDKIITNFGILMDPLADKVLICSAFIAFVDLDRMPAWMVIIIVARELAITGLRLLAASQNVVLPAESLGKYKTMLQFVAICSVLTSMSYGEWGSFATSFFEFRLFGGPWVSWFTQISIWLAVILTLISGISYLRANRSLYLKDS